VDAAEQPAAGAHRQPAGDPAQPVDERGRPALLLHLALDRAPEQVHDLGTRSNRVTRCSRMASKMTRGFRLRVQDVCPDVERVVHAYRLLEEVRQRQQRHDPVLHRPDDPVERLGAGQHVCRGQHHALGVPVVPEVNTSSKISSAWGAPTLPAGSQSDGTFVRVRGQVVDEGRGEVVQPHLARVGCVAAAAEDQPTAPDRSMIPGHRVGGHARVERDEDQRAYIEPK